MLPRLQKACALTGLCLICLMTGAHMLPLKAVVWSKMIVDYSEDMSLSDAVSQTFSGEDLCSGCYAIIAMEEVLDQSYQDLFKVLGSMAWIMDLVVTRAAPPKVTSAEKPKWLLNVLLSYMDRPEAPPPRRA